MGTCQMLEENNETSAISEVCRSVHSVKDDIIYGVDVSFPMHHSSVSQNYAWLPHNINPEDNPTPAIYSDTPVQHLGDRQSFYEEYMSGCRGQYSDGGGCDANEADRIAMCLRQPQSMQNYTANGFKKIRTPDHIYQELLSFWEANNENQTAEKWNRGNVYTNNWAAPTYMVSVEDDKLEGGGPVLKQKIWNLAQSTIEEWTGQSLTGTSLYGVRVYKEGAVLSPHVDRLPLVSSAIVNVAQDVDEDWPIEVIGHDGRAHNITMEPGDMVLYESHSVIHGRPYPLKGRFYANVFIHFEPRGHSERHHQKMSEEDNLPSYIVRGTPEEANWRRNNPVKKKGTNDYGQTKAHIAAALGDLKMLKELVEVDRTLLLTEDHNGWLPIHEAARAEEIKVLIYLLSQEERETMLSHTTNHGAGGNALHWAKVTHGEEHAIVKLLESSGVEYTVGEDFIVDDDYSYEITDELDFHEKDGVDVDYTDAGEGYSEFISDEEWSEEEVDVKSRQEEADWTDEEMETSESLDKVENNEIENHERDDLDGDDLNGDDEQGNESQWSANQEERNGDKSKSEEKAERDENWEGFNAQSDIEDTRIL